MARKPSAKPKLAPAGGKTAGIGHNSGSTAEQLSDDNLQALTRQHRAKRAALVRAEKDARSARMNHDKTIKAELGAKGLADIKLLDQLDTPEGEAALKAEFERQMRVARWAGLSVGTQADMFGPDTRSLRERAFEEGKRDGMLSEGPLNPPGNYSPASDGYEGYIEGWHVGQAAINTIRKPADSGLLRPEGNEPDGQDAFDNAANGESGDAEPEEEQEDPPAEENGTPAAEEPPAGGGEPWPDDKQVGERQQADVL